MQKMFSFAILILSVCQLVFGGFKMADNCRIYCQGPLLEAVQKTKMFHDSKDFVDMPLKVSPDETLQAFSKLKNISDLQTIREFVEEYFLPPGTELDTCLPRDWTPKPKTFDRIKDPVYRYWAYAVSSKWRSLCRKVKETVKEHSELYSLIPVPHPFIAPGGRFREFYYWDTYWIVKGLLASEMTSTAKDMIRNLGEMIKKYGFVPNGGRVYYLRRTQPPLLAGCVLDYYKVTGDLDFVGEMLPLLDKEYKFWNTKRSVNWTTPSGESFQLYRYKVYQDTPRPESYKEDLSISDFFGEDDKIEVWSDIAAACESGWDFSSRWFPNKGPYKNDIRGIRTSQILPVDLNAFICWNSVILSELHEVVGNHVMSMEYANLYEKMKLALWKVFWNETDSTWYDVDMEINGKQSKIYYASSLTPMFTNCLHDYSSEFYDKVVVYIQKINAANFPGGLATSMIFTGEQWDSSNGWAPTNHMVIEGLRKSNSQNANDLAFELAEKWIRTNYFTYVKNGGKMFEKYDIESISSEAGGFGEYEVQEGFGWTNGVILDLLMNYGDRLYIDDPHDHDEL